MQRSSLTANQRTGGPGGVPHDRCFIQFEGRHLDRSRADRHRLQQRSVRTVHGLAACRGRTGRGGYVARHRHHPELDPGDHAGAHHRGGRERDNLDQHADCNAGDETCDPVCTDARPHAGTGSHADASANATPDGRSVHG